MTEEFQGRVIIAQQFDAWHFDAVIVQCQCLIENGRDRSPNGPSAVSAETQSLRRNVDHSRYFAICGCQVTLCFRGEVFVLQKEKKIRDSRQQIVDMMRNARSQTPTASSFSEIRTASSARFWRAIFRASSETPASSPAAFRRERGVPRRVDTAPSRCTEILRHSTLPNHLRWLSDMPMYSPA